jgi:hypothetical protein
MRLVTLNADAHVNYIEPDGVVTIQAQKLGIGKK